MAAAAEAKVSGIVLVGSLIGKSSAGDALPGPAQAGLAVLAGVSGIYTLWKIQPVLKAVQDTVAAESSTSTSDGPGGLDSSTAQYAGTLLLFIYGAWITTTPEYIEQTGRNFWGV